MLMAQIHLKKEKINCKAIQLFKIGILHETYEHFHENRHLFYSPSVNYVYLFNVTSYLLLHFVATVTLCNKTLHFVIKLSHLVIKKLAHFAFCNKML